MTCLRDQHLFSTGPKKILSLDGGGVRGILTLQILKRLESIVRHRLNNNGAVLSDYFDLIGGTSTGAIIAAGLALGWEVSKLEKIYMEVGVDVFKEDWYRKGILFPKFKEKELTKQLNKHFGTITIGSEELKTGLAIVLKRLDTGSPWIIHNNPRSKYFDQRYGSTATPNKDYSLARVVRASTAAPTYFKPESMEVCSGVSGAFVDGGVSPHNNPALQLFMLATIKSYGLNWKKGEEDLLLVSVGTGGVEPSLSAKKLLDSNAAKLGITALSSLMDDASALNETLLQWLSRSPTARVIDSELGDLNADILGAEPQLSYLRYQSWLDKRWLSDNLRMSFSNDDIDSMREMDNPSRMEDLKVIGLATAEKYVSDLHFSSVFDK